MVVSLRHATCPGDLPDVMDRCGRGSSEGKGNRQFSKVVITMEQAERANALFVSDLQPSQHPTPGQVAAAIEAGLRQLGTAGCAAAAAAEYGEHPDTAPIRMRWALQALFYAA